MPPKVIASETKALAQVLSMCFTSSKSFSMILFFLASLLVKGHFSADAHRTKFTVVDFAAAWTVLRPAKRSTSAMSIVWPSLVVLCSGSKLTVGVGLSCCCGRAKVESVAIVTILALLPVFEMSAGRFIVTFEKASFEKADDCARVVADSRADGLETP